MKVIGLFITLILVWVSVQSQEEYISLEIEPSSVEVGVPVTITIKSNTEGRLVFDMPDEFIKSGPAHSGMSSSINYDSGQGVVEKYSFEKFSGYFEQEGEYEIGPIKLITKKGEIFSEIVRVKVEKPLDMISEDPSKNMDQAIFGIIQQSKKEIFVGESFLAEAKVFAQLDVMQVDNYTPFKVQGPSEVHDLDQSNQVSRNYEQIKGRDVMTFKLGKTLIFMDSPGTFEISPFEMLVFYNDPRSLFPERALLRSNTSLVRVKPLPKGAPVDFKGGVGSYKISAFLKDDQVEQGKVVELVVKVSGKGNIHMLDQPQLNLPDGMVLYGDPEINEDIAFTTSGAGGEKTFTFFIEANVGGSQQIDAISMSYFNPVKEKYERTQTKAIQLNVIGDQKVVIAPKKAEEVVEEIQSNNLRGIKLPHTYRKESATGLFQGWTNGLVTAPLLLGILFGFFIRYKSSHAEAIALRKEKKSALKSAKDSMNILLSSSEQSDEVFYNELTTILLQYLATVWNLSPQEITRITFRQATEEGRMNEHEQQIILSFMNEADQVKYSGVSTFTDRKQVTQQLIESMEEIEKLTS